MSTAGAPTGVLTFLFTDIEGSTRRWESDAAAMRTALAGHDDVLRNAVESHGGWLFKHTGDGVCAVFGSPRDALDAAVEAQRHLALPVRMGLATGEAELRGEDYFGVVLNRAARVMAAGHGGQILLADSTAAVLSGADLVDLGQRRLRDLPTAIGLFQARADGLRTDFPPLRTLDPTPGNLRSRSTTLIGRDAELARLTAQVRDHRLVTLTGVGGVGKTSLALAAAHALADEFVDGVWVFELAAVIDPAAVPDAVATVLGVTGQAGRTPTETIATALEGRVRLLVFDNCEHVLDAAAALIDAILAQSTTVRILATSREGLNRPEEWRRAVPALDVDAGPDSAAVALFVERASAVSQWFSIEAPDDVAAVVEICRRLDGIPLAIELAASRMASMTVRELNDRLDHRFRLLVGPKRNLERHQTLRHAVAWSYDLLSDDEALVLQRCSVFVGGFDLDGTRAVAGSAQRDEIVILDLLDALVRKSLLTVTRAAGQTRFGMLETIRQFAAERLDERGDTTTARTLHARHFAAREGDVLALWDSPRQRAAYDWFALELANLRHAFRWSADHGDLDSAAAIATYTMFLGAGVESYEPIAWAEELVAPARAAGHRRLAALYVAAAQCWMPGRIEQAVQYADEGQATVGASDAEVAFGTHGWLGAAYLYVGEPQRWVQWCRAQLAFDRDTHTLTRTCLVLALTVTGDADEAAAATDGLVAAARATGNPYALCFAVLATGFALEHVNPQEALEALRLGFAIAHENGDRFNETQLAVALSVLTRVCGNPAAALDYLEVAIRRWHDAGNTANLRIAMGELATVLDLLGQPGPAATVAGFALSRMTNAAQPDLATTVDHVRQVLGDDVHGSLAAEGESMSRAAAVRFALEQIERERTPAASG